MSKLFCIRVWNSHFISDEKAVVTSGRTSPHATRGVDLSSQRPGWVAKGTSFQTTPLDIAEKISKELVKKAIVAKVISLSFIFYLSTSLFSIVDQIFQKN